MRLNKVLAKQRWSTRAPDKEAVASRGLEATEWLLWMVILGALALIAYAWYVSASNLPVFELALYYSVVSGLLVAFPVAFTVMCHSWVERPKHLRRVIGWCSASGLLVSMTALPFSSPRMSKFLVGFSVYLFVILTTVLIQLAMTGRASKTDIVVSQDADPRD